MIEKMINNTSLKLFVLKLLAYLLIIISFVMFGKSWLTFESSRTRRDITQGITEALDQLQGVTESDWNELNDSLADYDLDITGEELVEKEIEAFTCLEDAEVSPKEAMLIIKNADWLIENAGSYIGIEKTPAVTKIVSKYKTYSILIQVLYYVTILAFIGSILAMMTSRGIGTYSSSVTIIIQFILFAIFKSRLNTFLDPALGALGISTSGRNLAMRFCPPAIIAFICAIAASVICTVLLIECRKERVKIPGLVALIGKAAKASENRKIVSKSSVCLCGAKLNKNDKFCPVCGRKVTDTVPKTCKSCGAVLEPDSRFCPDCGAVVEDDIEEPAPTINRCLFCGQELENGALFCSNCGRKQTEKGN